MRFSRRSPRTAVLAVVASALLLTGCAAATPGGPGTAPTATTAAAAPAGAAEYGLPVGTGKVSVQLWTDLSCPFCQALEAKTGDRLAAWVADGTVTFTIHPLNFVSAKHDDATDWSTRAANALAAAVDAGDADALPALYGLLQRNQTLADGTHPTDEDILAIATQAGVTADISDAVASREFGAWVRASNDHWLGRTIDATQQVVKGVPILVVDGTVISADVDGALPALEAAVAAARG